MVSEPADPAFETALVALRVTWRFEAMEGRSGCVITALQSVIPDGVQLGRYLFEAQVLRRCHHEGMSAATMLDTIALLMPNHLDADQ